ncbi:glutamate--tRNA ligase [Neoehrlichia mikurensis]|uniref:Glutamate--tRNA ligase n=1 Tax=Neoehrlichia mikurensis TaxID=89586 RepID=A0A9Q9BQI9_9RICK|nr:glutamate--tRNA ligase [Neoehrlichia mikurensis]QXK92203.1 glutamate--tRNA ligase [Neoehrlichia mikurensis]QXK92659.1 glutamate--tRNA ligase [Neoehrlichia mikurensis]QXK93896.1 glutamate--tRNA ligase [Neoehrlichia mikurensis]UTO55105.1 glutamate--tRNA ligase [Neoehrlichia mikurensis]UTO56024.1 glutamate--tRNA ligase [Neoehrlichia mikurensis]
MITRFAPSPTGHLHIGNIRTALVCWLYARQQGGKFLLRIDDTDVNRSNDQYIQKIKNDLSWLFIDWDMCFNQSSRFVRYDEVFHYLLDKGIIYPCYETQEELELQRVVKRKAGLPPIYDRNMLEITDKEKNTRNPYFRLEINKDMIISWQDKVRGQVTFNAKNISDPVIRRTDGQYTYMLPSVIDDMDYQVTHVIRGEDHISNTATQIYIMKNLNAKIPDFAHLSLLHFGDKKVSKRVGGFAIEYFRENSIEPMTINSYIAKIGTSCAIEVQTDMSALIDTFDIQSFSNSSSKFVLEDLIKLNAKVLHKMPFYQIKDRLNVLGVNSEEFWYSICNNIERLTDVKSWVNICSQNVIPIIDPVNKRFISLAKDLLPSGEFNEDTWGIWIQRIKENTHFKARDIFMPLRLALTGLSKGPELAKLLPLIGREEIMRRLNTDNLE